jgi:hypothetical protein
MKRVTVTRVLLLLLVVAPSSEAATCERSLVDDTSLRAEHASSLTAAGSSTSHRRGLSPSRRSSRPYPTYHLDAGCRARIIVFGQDKRRGSMTSIPQGESPSPDWQSAKANPRFEPLR